VITLKQILVRGPNWIGDSVMAIPFFQALREIYPKAHLTWAGPEPTLLPRIRECFDVTVPLPLFRAGQFDLGISLPASFRSAWWLARSGASRRVGYAEIAARVFYDDYLAWPGRQSGRHKSELYLDLVRWMSGHARQLPLSSQSDVRERLIVIAPGASLPLREWPYFAELLVAMEKKFPDYRFVLVGGKREATWSSIFRRLNLKRTEDRLGQTSIDEAIDICKRAAVVVANDSGMAHVAASEASASTVVLFGPGDPVYVRPRGDRVFPVFADHVPCRPCESARCKAPFGYQLCLRQLDLETVLQRVDEAL